jgi:hypothetical protein
MATSATMGSDNPTQNRIRFVFCVGIIFLARIFHSEIEQRSGESVRRLDITQPNENATHRFLYDRL